MEFPERLRSLRKEAKLSQRELADRVGVDFTYLSKIENNRVEPPSETVLKKLAGCCQASLAKTKSSSPTNLSPQPERCHRTWPRRSPTIRMRSST